jgi:hypothetical protein
MCRPSSFLFKSKVAVPTTSDRERSSTRTPCAYFFLGAFGFPFSKREETRTLSENKRKKNPIAQTHKHREEQNPQKKKKAK